MMATIMTTIKKIIFDSIMIALIWFVCMFDVFVLTTRQIHFSYMNRDMGIEWVEQEGIYNSINDFTLTRFREVDGEVSYGLVCKDITEFRWGNPITTGFTRLSITFAKYGESVISKTDCFKNMRWH